MKNYIIIIISAVLVFLLAIRGCEQERHLKSYISTAELLKKTAEDTAKKYRDLYGNEHAYAQKLIVDKLYLQNEIESLSKRLKVKPKNINGFTTVTSKGEIKVVVDTFYRDADVIISLKRDTLNMTLNDTLVITDYWKRKWFLGKKHYYIDIYNTNRYITLDKIVAREIKGRRKKD